MKKGISIPITTLVTLAVAVIVLLAAVAWFMGAFGPTASQQTLRQNFDNACVGWARTNCAKASGFLDSNSDEVPDNVCKAYNAMSGRGEEACDYTTVAKACNCVYPYGIGGNGGEGGGITSTTIPPIPSTIPQPD